MSTDKIATADIFSRRLRQARGVRGKAEFARFLGITAQNYQRYEAGRVPSADILQSVADKCETTVDWLLGREKEALAEEASRRPMAHERVLRLVIHVMSPTQLIERQNAIVNDDTLTEAERIAAVKIIAAELARRETEPNADRSSAGLRSQIDVARRVQHGLVPRKSSAAG